MKRIVLGAGILCVCAGATFGDVTTRAAGDYLFDTYSHIRLGRGDVTWSGAINFFSPVGVDGDTTFDFQAAVGYFVTDYIEVEGAGLWQDSGGLSGGRVFLGANRYFGEWTDNIYPYLGASIYTGFEDLEQDEIGLQIKVGVRHYLSRHMGLRYWAEFNTDFDQVQEGSGTFSGFIGIFAHPY